MGTTKEASVHKEQLRYLWRIRMIGIVIALILIVAGIIGTFLGLQGSFDWAIQTPSGVGGKITNASPGILLTLFGFFLAWHVIGQRAIDVRSGWTGASSSQR